MGKLPDVSFSALAGYIMLVVVLLCIFTSISVAWSSRTIEVRGRRQLWMGLWRQCGFYRWQDGATPYSCGPYRFGAGACDESGIEVARLLAMFGTALAAFTTCTACGAVRALNMRMNVVVTLLALLTAACVNATWGVWISVAEQRCLGVGPVSSYSFAFVLQVIPPPPPPVPSVVVGCLRTSLSWE